MTTADSNPPQPHSFGEIAQKMGLLTPAQLEEGLRQLKAYNAPGRQPRLGEMLVSLNFMTVEQVKRVLSEQRKLRKPTQAQGLTMEYFGEFKLLAKLGQGAMGAVLKAEEPLTGRVVALKVLLRELALNPGFIQRFDREGRMAGALNHPNIVACHSAGTWQGSPYLVLEFVDGENLSAYCKRCGGRLPEGEALRIMRAVALGLAHAHSKGVVHRDIKPDNILLGKDGSIKISDFGTAKSFVDDDSLSRTGFIIGTPYYISPEQVRGKKIDHRADFYSLGGTLYKVLTGHAPFEAKNSLEIMRRHLQDELENPADICPELSPGTVQIVSKLMAKAPEERYQEGLELVEDIDSVMAKQKPLHATLEQTKSSIMPRRPLVKKKKQSGAGCFSVLVLGIPLLAAVGYLSALLIFS